MNRHGQTGLNILISMDYYRFILWKYASGCNTYVEPLYIDRTATIPYSEIYSTTGYIFPVLIKGILLAVNWECRRNLIQSRLIYHLVVTIVKLYCEHCIGIRVNACVYYYYTYTKYLHGQNYNITDDHTLLLIAPEYFNQFVSYYLTIDITTYSNSLLY